MKIIILIELILLILNTSNSSLMKKISVNSNHNENIDMNSNSIESIDANIYIDENSSNATITEYIKYKFYEGRHNMLIRKIMLDGSFDNLYDFNIITSDLKLIKSTISINCNNSDENIKTVDSVNNSITKTNEYKSESEALKQNKNNINDKEINVLNTEFTSKDTIKNQYYNNFSINNFINKFERKIKKEYVCIYIHFEEITVDKEKNISLGIKYFAKNFIKLRNELFSNNKENVMIWTMKNFKEKSILRYSLTVKYFSFSNLNVYPEKYSKVRIN